MVMGWQMHLQHLKVFILVVSILVVSELIIATQFLFTVTGKLLQKLLVRSHQYVRG
jgi:hypothetical protein